MFYYLYDVTNQKETTYKNQNSYDAIPNDPSDAAAAAAVESPSESETEDAEADGFDNGDPSSYQQRRQQQRKKKRRRICIDDAIDSIGMKWSLRIIDGVQCPLLAGVSLLFLVDSMELAILAFLSKAVDQRIERYHDDYIAWAGVGGALIGAAVWGTLSDIVGRRQVSMMVSGFITVFGVVTALLCTHHRTDGDGFVVEGLLVSRFLVGFGLGGITVPYDLLAEWLPNHTTVAPQTSSGTFLLRRGQILLLVHAFWSIGSLFIFALLETQTLLSPEKGQLTGIELWWCALPAILATLVFVGGGCCCCSWAILESPRFLLAQGRNDEALHVLRCAATANGKDPTQLFPETAVLYSNESQLPLTSFQQQPFSPTASTRRLFSFQWVKLASALLFTYFGQAFCYRGTADMLVVVFDEDEHEQKYQAVLSAVSEVVGICLLLLTVDQWGRIPTQVVAYGLAALSCLTLAVWYSLPFLENGNVLIAMTFISRMLVFGGGCATWVSTAEVLSTEIRTTGHAVSAGMAGRLGAFAATLTLPRVDDIPILALIVFGVSLWVAFAAGDIPETKLKEMGRSYNLLGQSESWTYPR